MALHPTHTRPRSPHSQFPVCAIKTNGSLYCWGENVAGQLGLGNLVDVSVPKRVGSKTWVSVECGYRTTCAIDSDGWLFCW
jgi:alpha-tubulin suppressor-like RCC1 family protein